MLQEQQKVGRKPPLDHQKRQYGGSLWELGSSLQFQRALIQPQLVYLGHGVKRRKKKSAAVHNTAVGTPAIDVGPVLGAALHQLVGHLDEPFAGRQVQRCLAVGPTDVVDLRPRCDQRLHHCGGGGVAR